MGPDVSVLSLGGVAEGGIYLFLGGVLHVLSRAGGAACSVLFRISRKVLHLSHRFSFHSVFVFFSGFLD